MKKPNHKELLLKLTACDIEGSLDSIILILKKAKKDFKDEYNDLMI